MTDEEPSRPCDWCRRPLGDAEGVVCWQCVRVVVNLGVPPDSAGYVPAAAVDAMRDRCAAVCDETRAVMAADGDTPLAAAVAESLAGKIRELK